jgi:hypothetical protein
MKYRFAVELDFDGSADDAQALLDEIIHRGMRAFGHTSASLPVSVEKIRQRSLDFDKKVGEQ